MTHIKHPIKLLMVALLIIVVCLPFIQPSQSEREKYEEFLRTHPFNNRDVSEVNKMPKRDRPDLAWEQNFLQTMNPATGRPESEKLFNIYQEQKALRAARVQGPGAENTPWVERGPTNVGGRTRALAYDPNVTDKVWAGSVSGGLWFNNDITDANSEWQSVDDFWDNLATTCIAFDPNNSSTIYVGTGEGWFNLDAVRGAGIWKSTDGGNTWSQLSASAGYHYIHDLVVKDETSGVGDGVLYATVRGTGIQRSTNGGTSFSTASTSVATDMSLAPDGRIWAGTNDGKVIYSDDGTTWMESHNSGMGRTAIASAPSDANYVYALIEDGNQVGTIIYTSDQGANWITVTEPADVDNGIPDTDFSRNQAWYDLVIAVDPADANTVVVGGIDLFRSTDNGANWGQISKWSNNNNLFGLNASLVHADQHAIVFKGGGSTEVIFGNDGGVFYSADLTNAATQDLIPMRNNQFNVTQYYACAIHPTLGEDYFLAGSQDNGTQRYQQSGLNATTEISGGDGAFCFIDQSDPQFQITSYTRNNYYLFTNGGDTFAGDLLADSETGLFINCADYDDNLNILYTGRDASSIYRVNDVTGSFSSTTISISLGANASHIRVSPHTAGSTTLYVGTSGGRVFKVEQADGSTPSVTEITGSSFSGSVSCIEIGASEDELLVTFSNYGVNSVWYSTDGGSTWSSREGNLPDMPVRWALFNPNNRSEVILATELGVWTTNNISNASTVWSASNSGLANVRVDMLQYRDSDDEVIAATHGRGLFSSNAFRVEAAPSVDFVADATFGCGSSLTVNFTDLSSSFPVASSYAWEFPGGTPSSANTQIPPPVTYSTNGEYTVTLTVTNAVGTVTETKTNYISLGTGVSLPLNEGFEGVDFPPSCWMTYRGLNGRGTVSDWFRTTSNMNSGVGGAYVIFEPLGTGENSEDWLVTPQLNLSKSLKSSLSFFARQRFPEEYNSQYHIRVSTTSQTDISSFVTQHTFTEADFLTTYSQYTVDLSDYDGMSIYVAFVLDQNDGDDWMLDDISVSGSIINITSDNGLDICEGETTTLSVVDDGAFSYVWKKDGIDIGTATSNSFQPTESGEYSVAVTSNGVTVTSSAVTVTITPLPVINVQPEATASCLGQSATFTVDASGSDLTYQWQFDGEDIIDDASVSGATTATLTASDLTVDENGVITCIVKNGNCTVTTTEVQLQVVDFQAVTTDPVGDNYCKGDNVVLSVAATGTDLTYQWYMDNEVLADGDRISGATTNTLTVSSSLEDDAGDYYCEVGSACGTTTNSANATVTIEFCLDVNQDMLNEISFYPNPTSDVLHFNHDPSKAVTNVAIYSVNGQLVLTKSKIRNNQVNLTQLKKGLYVMNLEVDGISIQYDFIKK